MSHPLQQEVKAVGRRARLLASLHALGWCAAFVLGAAFLVGLADYAFRVHDQGVRFICSSAVLLMLAWSLYRFAYPALVCRWSDVQLAQRIERRFPQLGDELSSSIAFLLRAEDDPATGSAALKRAVVAQTARKMESLRAADCLDASGALRALAAAASVSLTVAGICLFNLPSARLAGRRLLQPWSDAPWPRWNELEFQKAPTRLAKGDDFEVELIDKKDHLPAVVEIQCRFEGEGERVLVRPMNPRGDKMVYRIENVTRPFLYRAVGGDDDAMDWIPLQVDEPPRVLSLQVRSHPPEYTGWSAEETTNPFLFVLEGTRLEMEGRASELLEAAKLVMQRNGKTTEMPARLQPQSDAFSIGSGQPPWIAHESAAYWLDLKAKRTGLTSGGRNRWELRVAPDAPPTVSLNRPAAHSFVTAEARTQLNALVKDDLAIRLVELRYGRSDETGQKERSIVLYRGPDRASPTEAGHPNRPGGRGETRSALYSWDLAQLPRLEPGDWIEYHVAACDYKGQCGQSAAQRLIVISVDEWEDRIAQQQTQMLTQLGEILSKQQTCRSQVASLAAQLHEAGGVSHRDLDRLQSAELVQREVARMVSQEPEGVPSQIDGLLEELERNRLDRPEIKRRMEELLGRLKRVNREQMPVIQREMTTALKIIRDQLRRSGDGAARSTRDAGPKRDETAASALDVAGQHQDSVIRVLEQLTGELAQWGSYRRFSREISRLRRDQEELLQRTKNLGLETLAKHVEDLDAQQTANLKRLVQRQNELALSLDKTQSQMEQMRRGLQEDEPLAAATIDDALQIVQRSAISGQMRESSRSIEQNQLSNAADRQDSVLRSLQEVLDALADRREHELGRILKKLLEADAELAGLRRKQSGLQQQMDEAAHVADQERLGREFKKLAGPNAELGEQVGGLAGRLKRLQARRSAEAAAQAAAQLDQAARAAEHGDPSQSLGSARLAQQRLEEARRRLAQEMTRTQQDLLREQLGRLDQDVSDLSARQQSLLDQTVKMEARRQQQDGRLTRPQAATVGELAAAQRSLAAEAGRLTNRLGQHSALAAGLEDAANDMGAAARSLEQGATDDRAQQPQARALLQLHALLAALQPHAGQDDGESASDRQDGSAEAPQRDDAPLAELQMVRFMQQEIHRRTTELMDRRRRAGKWDPQELGQLDRLAQQQDRLAGIVLRFGEELGKQQSPPP